MAKARAGTGGVAFEFPVLGIDLSKPLSQQEAGTTPACLNVVPFDPAAGRGRGGQRAGLTLVAPFNTNRPVQFMQQIDVVQANIPGLTGYAGIGPNLETSLSFPAGIGVAAFNAQEAGTPWSAWQDATLLANALFRDHTAVLDTTNIASANVQVNGPGFGIANTFLAAGNGIVSADPRYVSINRKGSTAPAGTWGPTYQAYVEFQYGSGAITGTLNRTYLLFIADGTGGSAHGNFAAGIGLRDRQYLEFVTIADNAAPVIIQTIDLVALFNALFPTAVGGPMTAPMPCTSGDTRGDPGGNPFVGLSLYKAATTSSGASTDQYMAQVHIKWDNVQYIFGVGLVASPTAPYVMNGTNYGGIQDSISFAFDAGGNALLDGVMQNLSVTQAQANLNIGGAYVRSVKSMTVSNGNVYAGSPYAQAIVPNAISPGNPVFANPYQLISGDYGGSAAYMVDGTLTVKYDPTANTISNLVATKGILPGNCIICVEWRDRLILANQQGGSPSPQAIFASRQGDYTDWQTSTQDAQGAWSLTPTGNAGHINGPIQAFAPVNDDIALVATSSSLFIMDGDPQSGGQVVLLSAEIGMMGQEAWDVDPKGVMYFVGTGGFYRWHPAMRGYYGEKALDNLSEKRAAQLFQGIDRTQNNVFVRYDRDRHGCWICICPTSGGQGTHYWWDARTEGFFAIQWPAAMSPTFLMYLDGDTPSQRCILLGGNDGNVRQLDYTALSDAGTAIGSYVYIGPKPLGGPFTQSIIQGMEFWLGSEPVGAVNVAWGIQVGDDAVSSFAAAAAASGTFTSGGRQTKQRGRSRGCYATLKLSNAVLNTGYTLEQVAVITAPGGQNR